LTWQEIAEMQRNGMSFQSHAHEHVDLTRLCDAELGRQLKVSKQILEGQLGRSVDYLAAPYGQMNHRVIDCALRVGYQAVCSARNLPARAGSRKLNRVVIYRGTSIREFQQLLGCRPWRYFRRLARSPFYRARNLFMPIRPAQSADRLPEGMP
jgi:peptidoglycan/xylan/chitin deacetylase (PgdA/CDA1 family)